MAHETTLSYQSSPSSGKQATAQVSCEVQHVEWCTLAVATLPLAASRRLLALPTHDAVQLIRLWLLITTPEMLSCRPDPARPPMHITC